MYQFNYSLTDKDYFDFNKYHMCNAPAMKKMITGLRILLIALLFFSLLSSLRNHSDATSLLALIIVYTAVSVAWFFAVKPYLVFLTKINIKLIKKDGKLPYGKNVLINFEEDFFVEATNDTEIKGKYKSVEKIAVAGDAIYIYISAMQAFILPISVFESTAQKNEFLEFINGKKRELDIPNI